MLPLNDGGQGRRYTIDSLLAPDITEVVDGFGIGKERNLFVGAQWQSTTELECWETRKALILLKIPENLVLKKAGLPVKSKKNTLKIPLLKP